MKGTGPHDHGHYRISGRACVSADKFLHAVWSYRTPASEMFHMNVYDATDRLLGHLTFRVRRRPAKPRKKS